MQTEPRIQEGMQTEPFRVQGGMQTDPFASPLEIHGPWPRDRQNRVFRFGDLRPRTLE